MSSDNTICHYNGTSCPLSSSATGHSTYIYSDISFKHETPPITDQRGILMLVYVHVAKGYLDGIQ